MSTERKRVRIARHRASERSLCSSSRERTAVKRIFVCWMSVKDEAEMRSSATKERRFIPRKMSAGTAIFADVRTSLRLVSANQRGPRFALSWRRASPGSSGDSRRIISHEKHSLSTSPTARIDCADASSCSTPDE